MFMMEPMGIPLDIEDVLGRAFVDALKCVAAMFLALFMGLVVAVFATLFSGVVELVFMGSFIDAVQLLAEGLFVVSSVLADHFLSVNTIVITFLFAMGIYQFVLSEGGSITRWLWYTGSFAVVIWLALKGVFTNWWWLELLFLLFGIAMLVGGGVFLVAWERNRLALHFAEIKAEAEERKQRVREETAQEEINEEEDGLPEAEGMEGSS